MTGDALFQIRPTDPRSQIELAVVVPSHGRMLHLAGTANTVDAQYGERFGKFFSVTGSAFQRDAL